MLNGMGEARRQKWLANKCKPLKTVLKRAQAAAFPQSSYHGINADPDTMRVLHSIDPNFEIIYDMHTAKQYGPGHHLYRRVKGDRLSADRELVLEFSLQYDLDKPWPEGVPREPGRWVVDAVRQRLKGRTLDEKDPVEQAIEDQDRMQDKADAEVLEMEQHFEKEMRPLLQKVDDGRALKGKHRRYRPKDRKTTVQV